MDQPSKVTINNLARRQLNKINDLFTSPCWRLGFWSRETGSAVPSRVSLFILHTQAEPGSYSRDSSRFPRRRPFIYTAIRHWFSPEFIGSRNCVPMSFTAESPSAPATSSPQGIVPVAGAASAGQYGPLNMRLSFLTPTIGMQWECCVIQKVQYNIGGGNTEPEG